MKKSMVLVFTAVLLSIASLFGEELTPQEKRARSITAAKLIAQRNMVEIVFGQKLDYMATVSNLNAATFKNNLTSTAKANIRGISFASEYDAKRDIAIVTAVLNVKDIADLAPGWKNAITQKVRCVGFASCTPASANMLQALRAAELDAYRSLFEKVAGFSLESKSTVKDLVLKDDLIASKVVGSIMCAVLISDPKDKDTIEWSDSSSGASCTVTLELDLRNLEAILGQKFAERSADIIRVKGIGIQNRPVVKKEPKVIIKKEVKIKEVVIEREPKTKPVKSQVLN